ncbi:MAG TPA: UDP-glucose/GDP-mannose dehydrogenase family protein [Chromatiales bacterium]|nr:UDP-glucose/GDP-mannose dehydrogenase family protein [Chromatiales bacterium]
MNISIFGLGYVGAVSLACLARDGHKVIGVDIDPSKLDLIKSGQSPIIEEGMPELVAEVAIAGNVEVTTDTASAIQNSDISFVCVGTPSQNNGSQNLNAIERISEQLGEAIKNKEQFHTIVIRSTVVPGTVEKLIGPTIEKFSGKKNGQDFGLCFQPEFLREGSSIKDYDNPPLTVIGGGDERSIQQLRKLFGHLPADFVTTSVRSAEMLKTCCNVFHALKITFANEIGRLCQGLEVDSREVMDLICRDHQLNISKAYLKPGFAFGGSCLPKDTRALLYLAKHEDISLPMLAGLMPSNELHVEHAIDVVLNSGKKSVGMIGLSFKSGTDDLRESPLVAMAERFIGKGLDLKIFDPEVNVARLVGANRRYIEETIPHISSLMKETCQEVIEQSDVIVVGLNDKPLLAQLYEYTTENHLILDLVDVPNQEKLSGNYVGVCW